jgi:hypothetical protein
MGAYRAGIVSDQVDTNATLWQCQASKNYPAFTVYSMVSIIFDLIAGFERIGAIVCGS